MNVITFNGLLTDEQLKQIESILNENGKLEASKINNKVFEYPAFEVIKNGHSELKDLGSFKIGSLLQKIETASFNIGTGMDFKTGMHLTNYLNKL